MSAPPAPPAAAAPAALRVEGLTSGYGDLVVVRDVSFDVHHGEICVMLGRNGAGKTTTLSSIAGLCRSARGGIWLDGACLTGLTPYKRVRAGLALVQQGKRLFHHQTVEQNLLLGGFVSRRDRAGLRDAMDQQYEQFPMLARYRQSKAGGLSGGQQQMLAVAQALMSRPRVLMLDEPSLGLAPIVFGEVIEHLAVLRTAGLAIVLVEQLLDRVLPIADSVLVLDSGSIAARSDDASITPEDVRAIYLGERHATDRGSEHAALDR